MNVESTETKPEEIRAALDEIMNGKKNIWIRDLAFMFPSGRIVRTVLNKPHSRNRKNLAMRFS